MLHPSEPEIDTLVAAFYAVFDNRGGRAPATASLKAMFKAGAMITRLAGVETRTWTVEAFIAPREAMLTDGTLTDFHEVETEARTAFGGDTAFRWSRYEKSGWKDGAAFGGAGRKLFEFSRVKNRWVIASILWEDDEDGIPAVINI